MLRTRPHNFSNVPTARRFSPVLGRELVTERVTKPRKTKIPPSGEGGRRYLKKSSGFTETEIEINSDLIGHADLVTFTSYTYANKYHIWYINIAII